MEQDRVVIETPEHVEFSYELAGLGSRFLALTVDFLLLMVAKAALALLVVYLSNALHIVWPALGEVAGMPLMSLIIVGVSGLSSLAYFTLFEAYWNGQTPGKRVGGMRVIKAGGGPIGLIESLTRNILRIPDFLPALYLLGGVFVFFTRDCQRVGDMAAGTIVVKERLWEYPDQEPSAGAVRPPEADDAVRRARAWVGSLSREQIETVRRFLERRDELTPQMRAELAARIAASLREQLVGVIPELDEAPERLFEIIYQAHLERQRGR